MTRDSCMLSNLIYNKHIHACIYARSTDAARTLFLCALDVRCDRWNSSSHRHLMQSYKTNAFSVILYCLRFADHNLDSKAIV